MIRQYLAVARRTLKHPTIQLAIAGAALQYGLSAILNVVTELREEVTALNKQLADTRASLPTATYPAGEDLDPLDRARPNGRQQVYRYAKGERPEPEPAFGGHDNTKWGSEADPSDEDEARHSTMIGD